jgi:hypothetical protein
MTKPGVTKASTDEPTIIRLTRIKQFYIPADTDSYKVLVKLGVPFTKIPVDFLGTLKLLTDNHNVRGAEVPFREDILEPFKDKIARAWTKKYGKCLITSKEMSFKTTKPEILEDAKKAVEKLEDLLRQFFNRWSYKVSFEYSEARGRLHFHVKYWFDPDKGPVIPLETDPVELQPVQLRFGFTRITLKFDQQQNEGSRSENIGYVHIQVEVSQGGKFSTIHSSRCTYSQISSVKPMLLALMNIANKDQHNADNTAD